METILLIGILLFALFGAGCFGIIVLVVLDYRRQQRPAPPSLLDRMGSRRWRAKVRRGRVVAVYDPTEGP